MQPARLLKLMLLILSIAVVSRPSFAAEIKFASGKGQVPNIAAFAKKPRDKFDDRLTAGIKTAPAGLPATAKPSFCPAATQQLILAARLTKRHLLNIHFRIIPERKVYLRFQKITV